MPKTSKEILEDAKDQIEKAHKELRQRKDELEDLENQLRVEEKIFEELKEQKDQLSEFQEGVIAAVQSEVTMQKEKISEIETDIKLLAKKCEVLSRNTWMF